MTGKEPSIIETISFSPDSLKSSAEKYKVIITWNDGTTSEGWGGTISAAEQAAFSMGLSNE